MQQIQDTFADAFGVMFVITDLAGNLVTEPSNPCGLYTATEASPVARQRCVQLWSDLANAPSLQPAFVESHLGLLCARGLIKVGSELRAMLVVGGIAPAQWPPTQARIEEIADYLAMDASSVAAHINEVHGVSTQEQQRILSFVQRIADIIAHIITERNQLFGKLHDIAELTKM
ncbi:MAG: hypothetical protein HC802_20800 [Caldilineaceae bacterium]|nr:hypothetical protein [Caldilineaceae bacterium]